MNKKNWLLLILACAIAFTSFNSCSKDDEEDTTDTGPTEWVRSIVFKNDPRNGAASFTLNNQAYVVGGFVRNEGVVNDGSSFNGSTWTDISDFPGQARQMAVGFSINGKGYIGTGSTGTDDLADFYSYDPQTNTWTEIAPFPGRARYGAVAFTLGNYAYVGLGSTKTEAKFSDFYRYDPAANTWTEIPVPFRYKKAFAFSFVIGDKAYVGGGYANSPTLPEDFYSFDGTNWAPLADLNRSDDTYTYDVRKYNASAFVIGNAGYVVSGRGSGSGITSTVWKYEPGSDSWTDKHQSLPADAREKAVGFALDGKGYISTGINGAFNFDNTWQFTQVR
ncbi:Kelch repeat-containing protein [Sphingobacterium deserti]|uniref:Kelch repeat type 1-containing protein n=1 Tax=Sphingobacterium deserti TaxID=1229276 RepID=A0A0B8T4B8_9SPHI|nr:kelch repeat-containing protein [Sphingobacterium deserti]KGE14403.1 kelch repeat type 1-containing protein [Sphingobacterium deserti]